MLFGLGGGHGWNHPRRITQLLAVTPAAPAVRAPAGVRSPVLQVDHVPFGTWGSRVPSPEQPGRDRLDEQFRAVLAGLAPAVVVHRAVERPCGMPGPLYYLVGPRAGPQLPLLLLPQTSTCRSNSHAAKQRRCRWNLSISGETAPPCAN